MKSLVLLIVIVCPGAVMAADGGFLFVTFKGERTAMTEQIYFAASEDGRTWSSLNGGNPVLVSNVGEKGVRDPFLVRSNDGSKYFLLATDLSIHNNGSWKRAVEEGSKSLVIWQSADLVHWGEPRLAKVAADDAGCTWAPEAVYDAEAGNYLMFWASTNRRDHFAKQRIWASRTTDFVSFGKPFVYIERDRAVIDTDIVRDGGKYFRFSKDENFSAITMEVAPKLMGPWSAVPNFSLAKLRGYEGPECYPVELATDGRPATWCLVLDHFSKGGGYKPFTTHDLAGGQFAPAADFTFPFPFRHGSITPITGKQLAALRAAYGGKGDAK